MKKFLALLLTIAMVFSVAAFTLAANASVSTKVDNKNVTITIKDGADTINKVVPLEKNVVKTYLLGDNDEYEVKVEFNGNGVKSAIIVVTPPLSPAPPSAGLPNNGGSNGQENFYGASTVTQYNNANFHCNADGNGRVWTTLGKNVTQKLAVPLHFKANTDKPVSNQANKATAWDLVHDNVYICEECGSSSWVTFSNNSGVPDGGNIQMNHPGDDYIIEKEWIMLA